MRKISAPVSSLIEKIMMQDFYEFRNETTASNNISEMNFNRYETFIQDKLWIQGHEILQRDFNYMTPLHYFQDLDHEVDLTLQIIFENVDLGRSLPVTD